jgi:hypothetical protein
MNELDRPKAILLEPASLERLQLLWSSSESGEVGFNPKIEPGFELDYYAGSTLLSLRLRIGILRYYLAPTIKPDELARHFVASLEWIERDLDIVGESLRLAMNLIPEK